MKLQQVFLSLYQQKLYGQIIQQFESPQNTLRNEPTINAFYLNALRHTGEVTKARKGFERLYKKSLGVTFIVNSYGNLLIQLRELEMAITVLTRGIKQLGKQYELVFNLARAQQLNSQYKLALENFKIAATLNQSPLAAKLGEAECLASLGLLEPSKALYELLYQQAPTHLRLLINYCHLSRRLHDLTKAHTIAQTLIRLGPTNAQCWRNLGACNALLNHVNDTKHAYKTALQFDPDNTEIHVQYAHWLWFIGDDDPFGLMTLHIDNEPNNTGLWIAYINLCIKCNLRETAKRSVEKLLAFHPNDLSGLQLLSNIERDMHHYSEALVTSEKLMMLSSKPHKAELLNEHAYNLISCKQFNSAMKFAKILTKREPKDQGWWNLYSTCLRHQDKRREYEALCDYESLIHVADCKPHDVNLEELCSYLLQQHFGQRQPIGQSLNNGTQTLEELFDIDVAILRRLKSFVLLQVSHLVSGLKKQTGHPMLSRLPLKDDYYFTGSWSVKLTQQGFHSPHFHPAGWISGVFYVDVPKSIAQEGQGWIEFGRPNIPGLNDEPEFVVKPKAGRLALFPSYMWHGTRAFSSDETRLTVAFDLIPTQELS